MSTIVPGLGHEHDAWAAGRLLVGIDEVGRGPLAGPVVAAAVAFPADAARISGMRDSKVLSAARREKLVVKIRARAVLVGIGAASPREIDRLNIRRATALAMRRALHSILTGASTPLVVLLDGLPQPELGHVHEALIDGDARCYSIAAAGVLAKTVRDRLMVALSSRYPQYGWERNMGYGTPDHLAELRQGGPSPHHRKSFAPVTQLTLAL